MKGNSIVGWVILVAIMFISISMIYAALEDTDFETTTDVPIENNETVERDWLEVATAFDEIEENEEEEYIFVDRNVAGFYEYEFDVAEGTVSGIPLTLETDADLRDGDGSWTVETLDDDDEVIETQSGSLNTGETVEGLNFEKETDKIKVRFDLERQDNNHNEVPRLDRFTLNYADSFETTQVGLDNPSVILISMIVILTSIMLLITKA